jgi:hypothetical protein
MTKMINLPQLSMRYAQPSVLMTHDYALCVSKMKNN